MSGRMDLSQALGVLHELRGDAVVMPTMSTVAPWARLEPHPLDFVYLPSSMGQVTALALGLALARPERRVVALSGDGSPLMNLGSLVSIATAGASNLVIIVVDNGVYQVTGGQPTPAGPHVDLAAVARGCGVSSVHTFETVDAWRAGAPAVLGGEGPRWWCGRSSPIRTRRELSPPVRPANASRRSDGRCWPGRAIPDRRPEPWC